jgi:hypothetical protein
MVRNEVLSESAQTIDVKGPVSVLLDSIFMLTCRCSNYSRLGQLSQQVIRHSVEWLKKRTDILLVDRSGK